MPTTSVPSTATIQDQGSVSQCSLPGGSKWDFTRSRRANSPTPSQSYTPRQPSGSQSALYPPLKADNTSFFPPAVRNSLLKKNFKPSECTLSAMTTQAEAEEGHGDEIARTVPVSLVFETPKPPGPIEYAVSVVTSAAFKKADEVAEAFSLRG